MSGKWKHGSLCCVGRCSVRSSTSRDVSMFSFPSNHETRRLWAQFVGYTRSDFGLSNVTKFTKICSMHFNTDDVTLSYKPVPGSTPPRQIRRNVRKGAIPCIKYHSLSFQTPFKGAKQIANGSKTETPSPKRPRRSFQKISEKRTRQQVKLFFIIMFYNFACLTGVKGRVWYSPSIIIFNISYTYTTTSLQNLVTFLNYLHVDILVHLVWTKLCSFCTKNLIFLRKSKGDIIHTII